MPSIAGSNDDCVVLALAGWHNSHQRVGRGLTVRFTNMHNCEQRDAEESENARAGTQAGAVLASAAALCIAVMKLLGRQTAVWPCRAGGSQP